MGILVPLSFLFLMFVIFYSLYVIVNGKEIDIEMGQKVWINKKVIDVCEGIYIGGVKGLSANLSRNKKIYFLEDGIGIGIVAGKKFIKYSDIQDVYIESSHSIEQKVSMGKLICFGVLAFGMKKNEKNKIHEIVVINVKEGKEEYNVFVDCELKSSIQIVYNKIIKNKQNNEVIEEI